MSKYSSSKKIYTVQLEKKSGAGLGFLLRQRDQMPFLGVWEILKNESADQSGRIRKGDVILKVNKHDLSSTSYEKGLEIIRSLKADCLVELTLMQNEDGEKLNGI
ncbi:nitric oxide brain isoform X1, partial [Brachionus plicatilis]